jgi:hypothetical protein
MSDPGFLFSQVSFFEVCRDLESQILKEINSFQTKYLLNVSIEDLIEHLVDKYTMECPTLYRDRIELSDHGESSSVIEDYGEVKERKVNFYHFAVPYAGDKGLFFFKPSTFTYNPPSAIVGEQELRLRFEGSVQSAAEINSDLENMLSRIESYLTWIQSDVKEWNSRVRELVSRQINLRKEKLLKDQGIVTALGFPIRQRNGAPTTYAVPVKRKRIPISQPVAANEPFVPDYFLEISEYDNILKILSNMVYVMERSPRSFSTMREEDLRTHFLVVLNALYEGQAAGETFNFEGDTDILIRVKERNIFIAECKFWKGPKSLRKTIDQVLRYLSWRDTKVSILIFNRNKDFSRILSQIPDVISNHSNFKRNVPYACESGFRFILHSNIDKNRELIVTILAFDIPNEVT